MNANDRTRKTLPARAGLALIAAAAATAGAGCDNTYAALTAPPPGLTASLDNGKKSIDLSAGVSLGFECVSTEEQACSKEVGTRDRDIARVYPAPLDQLSLDAWSGPKPRSAFVVVGIAPGHTDIDAGGGSLSVTVHPDNR